MASWQFKIDKNSICATLCAEESLRRHYGILWTRANRSSHRCTHVGCPRQTLLVSHEKRSNIWKDRSLEARLEEADLEEATGATEALEAGGGGGDNAKEQRQWESENAKQQLFGGAFGGGQFGGGYGGFGGGGGGGGGRQRKRAAAVGI